MTIFKNKIRDMLVAMFEECKPDGENPNNKMLYYKDYEDDDYYGYAFRGWDEDRFREEIYYWMWPKTAKKQGYEGMWDTWDNKLTCSRNKMWTTKDSLKNYRFTHPYYSPVTPEKRVEWEANPTRPKSS